MVTRTPGMDRLAQSHRDRANELRAGRAALDARRIMGGPDAAMAAPPAQEVTMTSKYPTSAELAAMRREFSEATGNADPRFPGTVPALQHPYRYDRTALPHEAGSCLPVNRGGAWLQERKHGIGQRGYDPAFGAYALDDLTDARREAARIRHAAFERITFEAAGDVGLALDLAIAQDTFVSGWDRDTVADCDCHETPDEHDRDGERQDARIAY